MIPARSNLSPSRWKSLPCAKPSKVLLDMLNLLVVSASSALPLSQRHVSDHPHIQCRFAIPPVRRRSRNWPQVKELKRSLQASLREGDSVRRTPRKETKNESPGASSNQNSPVFWLRKLTFDSSWRVRRDPWRLPWRLPPRNLFDVFLAQGRLWLLCLTGGIASADVYEVL